MLRGLPLILLMSTLNVPLGVPLASTITRVTEVVGTLAMEKAPLLSLTPARLVPCTVTVRPRSRSPVALSCRTPVMEAVLVWVVLPPPPPLPPVAVVEPPPPPPPHPVKRLAAITASIGAQAQRCIIFIISCSLSCVNFREQS
jgi:hypothetical protein